MLRRGTFFEHLSPGDLQVGCHLKLPGHVSSSQSAARPNWIALPLGRMSESSTFLRIPNVPGLVMLLQSLISSPYEADMEKGYAQAVAVSAFNEDWN
jgi:hypothetical protein